MSDGDEDVDALPLELENLLANTLHLVKEDDFPCAGQVLGVRGHKANDPDPGAVFQGAYDTALVSKIINQSITVRRQLEIHFGFFSFLDLLDKNCKYFITFDESKIPTYPVIP